MSEVNWSPADRQKMVAKLVAEGNSTQLRALLLSKRAAENPRFKAELEDGLRRIEAANAAEASRPQARVETRRFWIFALIAAAGVVVAILALWR